MNIVDAALALVLLTVPVAFLVNRYRSDWAGPLSRLEEDDVNAGSFADFVRETPNLNDSENVAGASLMLADAASRLYDEAKDAHKSRDAKATTILGLVGGGASLIAVTSAMGASGHPTVTPLLGLSLLYFLGTLVACLLCRSGPEQIGLPKLRYELASPAMLNNKDTTRARVAGYLYLLTEQRIKYFQRLDGSKAYYLELSQQLFALGVVCLVANFGVASFGPAPFSKPTIMRCQAAGRTLVASDALTCTTEIETSR